MFQLNLSLVSLRALHLPNFPQRNLDVAEVESELGRVYRAWQETHGKVSQAEMRNQERKAWRHQEQFSDLVSQRLSRLLRAEQFVSNNKNCDHSIDQSDDDKKPSSPLSKMLKFGLVSGVMLVSVLSVTYLWSYNKCQQNYYNQIWPILSFSAGPRPY